MSVESIKQMAEIARRYAEAPHTVDREQLIAMIDSEIEQAKAEGAALRDWRPSPGHMLRREIDQARLEIEAASRLVMDAMTYFMLCEFCPGPSLPDSALGRAENLETALAAQLAVIDAISSRATELKSSLKSGWTVLT